MFGLEFLILFGVIGLCTKDDKSKKKASKQIEKKPINNYLLEPLNFNNDYLYPKKSQSYNFNISGYDSKRKVHWIREDYWDIEERI